MVTGFLSSDLTTFEKLSTRGRDLGGDLTTFEKLANRGRDLGRDLTTFEKLSNRGVKSWGQILRSNLYQRELLISSKSLLMLSSWSSVASV